MRIATGLFFLLVYLPYFGWLADLPRLFFSPPPLSVAALFTGYPGPAFFLVLEGLMAVAAAALTLGWRARWAGLVLAFTLIIGLSFQFSLGKIDHFSLLPISLVVLSFSDWGSGACLRPDRRLGLGALPLSVTAICLSFGMLTAGYYKLRGWVDGDLGTSGVLNWYYTSFHGDMGLLPKGWLLGIGPVWLEAMDLATVVFELLPILMLWLGDRAWRGWIAVACLFHFGTTLLLGIDFLYHVPVYLPFVLAGLQQPGLRRITAGAVTAVATLSAHHLLLSWWGRPAVYFMVPDQLLPGAVREWGIALIWLVLAGLAAWTAVTVSSPKVLKP